ncbi:MAG: hypothetical protein NTZ26_15515 [Candidatus Aminicenantes bacterium]|nr:hypothetical protein [Candidatus Aminicenantes bacterium]
MGLKRKEMIMQQKAYFEAKLQERKTVVAAKGLEGRKAEKDTLVRKFKANLKAVNGRLKAIENHEKITADAAKVKADRLAAPVKEEKKEAPKAEKPKKGGDEAKEKKPKPEKKAAAPKAS